MIEIEAPDDYTCPLTLDTMEDPIMTKYGQSYERSAILQWLQSGSGVCPLSRRPLHLQDLVTNHGLRMKIQEWRKENGDESAVVVKPAPLMQIYGFITLPLKDDSTDRTTDEDDDLFYLQLTALRLGQSVESLQTTPEELQPETTTGAATGESTSSGRRRTRPQATRRASTGSSLQTTSSRRRPIARPFRGLRNLLVGGSTR